MEKQNLFFDAGKSLVLSENIENDPRFGSYINKHGAEFSDRDFAKAIRLTESLMLPKNQKQLSDAKTEFERGWMAGQSERFQIEAITQDALKRKMHEKTIALISKERQRIAKELFR